MRKLNNKELINKKMSARCIKICDYLKENFQLMVPRYQREYSWEKKNINTLINDFKEDYYIGNIITYINNESKEKELIDGQQRMITTFLILIAIMQYTDDEDLIQNIEELIKNESGEIKLDLKSRMGVDGREILNCLVENKTVLKELEEKYNEISMFKYIKKQLSHFDCRTLYNNIINSKLVEISFENNETSAHEMFVNVNTKGKPLELIEILKSQIFKELLKSGRTDIYKESWQKMLEEIPKNEYDCYCSDVYLFDYFRLNKENGSLKTSGTVPENAKALIDSINSKQKASEIFEFMTGNDQENIFRVFAAIKKHKICDLKENYFSNKINRVSIDGIDNIWKLYGEYMFKQSDIMFTALLLNNDDFLASEINYVNIFMKFILMYDLCRAILNNSPANYANSFKQCSAQIYNSNNIAEQKNIIKQFVKDMKFDDSNLKLIKEKLISNTTFSNGKHKRAKFIILMAE